MLTIACLSLEEGPGDIGAQRGKYKEESEMSLAEGSGPWSVVGVRAEGIKAQDSDTSEDMDVAYGGG